MSRTFTELTTDTNVGGWIPSEDFADLILEAVVCYGDLSVNGISAMEYDMAAGQGDSVMVRTVTARTTGAAACASHAAGGCLSVTSTTMGQTNIEVYQWGDYDKIADFTEWKTKGNILQVIAKEMGKRMANCRDSTIWTNLCGATPNAVVNTASAYTGQKSRATDGVCCLYAFDLYNSIVSARQHLKGDCYNPDTVLIHPYAAAYLYYRDGGGTPAELAQIQYNKTTGYIEKILGMRVVEVGVAVADDGDPSASGDEVAMVLDSSRAFGEVFGKRPTFHEFYDGKCNAVELTCWQYWGSEVLDGNAIIHIESP